MARTHSLLVCTAVACAWAPVARALSPVAAGVLGMEQRRSARAPVAPELVPAAASAASGSAGGNLCRDGRQIPDFYVLGGKNTATSSLAHDLSQRGVFAAPQNKTKEWMFFRSQGQTPVPKQERKWLHSLPPCPAERVVMADFSVVNLFAVPLPEDLNLTSEVAYANDTSALNWNAAARIRRFSGEAAKDLKFLLMLREPLARVQSEYYHTLPLKNCHGCMVNGSFTESFAFNVGQLQQDPPVVSDWFWKSFYARQVEEYLRHFDAAQFTFVPFKQYISLDPPAFSAALLGRLGIQAEPWVEASHENAHVLKPPLDEELPPAAASRGAFEAFFAAENERLVRLLAQAQLEGAWLAGYVGAPGDAALIRAWLESSW